MNSARVDPAARHPDLGAHRDFLVRFALRRVRDPFLAEDLVHDVFEAVLSGRAVFAGRSALRTWMAAVLLHKLSDHWRLQRQGEHAPGSDAATDACLHGLPSPEAEPQALVEHREHLARALRAIDALPETLRVAMHLRVVQERTSRSVCETLAISEGALNVRLHRARKSIGQTLAAAGG
jgi:RNA polymerase sigma-70 factor (ECF subfamily)